jgi:hypothetical protein
MADTALLTPAADASAEATDPAFWQAHARWRALAAAGADASAISSAFTEMWMQPAHTAFALAAKVESCDFELVDLPQPAANTHNMLRMDLYRMTMRELAPDQTSERADAADSAILAAFARRRDAHRALATLTAHGEFGKPTGEEYDLHAVIDQAEQVILDTMASTPEGVAAKIFVAAHYEAAGSCPDNWALVDGDLPGLEAVAAELDWSMKFTLSALRSLRSLHAVETRSATWEAAYSRYLSARQAVWDFDKEDADAIASIEQERSGREPLDDEYAAAFEALRAVAPPTFGTLADKIAAYAQEEEYALSGQSAPCLTHH